MRLCGLLVEVLLISSELSHWVHVRLLLLLLLLILLLRRWTVRRRRREGLLVGDV